MKQGAGLAVFVAVAFASIRLAGGGAAQLPEVSAAPTSLVQRVASVFPPPGSYAGGCSAYDAGQRSGPARKATSSGPARAALDTFFRLDPTLPSAPQLAPTPAVRYAIALVPDPRRTNLGLMFDREMVVVQQAAEDDGYTYNSSWLPWSTEAAKFPLLADQQAADDAAARREACPGVLLFRKSLSDLQPDGSARPEAYGEALAVFVVGEQPTGGVNESQWANATRWLAENASPAAKPSALRILGPTFSGSLVSLDRDLTALYATPSTVAIAPALRARFPWVDILSGAVSSCSSFQWFQQRRDDHLDPTVQFGSFQQNDELHIFRFFTYLKSLGTDVRDTAILSEDETAYANGDRPVTEKPPAATPCDFRYAEGNRPLRLSYPRDISALRSAYEKQAVFASPTRGTHPILQEATGQGSEGSGASDTIRSFAGATSPLAQEAVLYGVVSYLRAHHSRYVLLRCTNPLDFLFLTRFFHRAYPEGRIVTVGSDLLYRREIDTTEFRGVLALSSYPLLPLNQHWSYLTDTTADSSVHVHRVFESHMEGAYIAARYLFGAASPTPATTPQGTLTLPWIENIPDYADPFWLHPTTENIQQTEAPTWVTVVGNDGYWPVAVLNDNTIPHVRLDDKSNGTEPGKQPPPSTIVRLTLADKQVHYQLSHDKSSLYNLQLLKFPLSWKICVGASFLLLLYQALGITVGARSASSTGLFCVFRHFSSFSQSLLLGINSAFASMLFLSLLSMGLIVPFSILDRETFDFWLCLVLALLTICAIAVVLFRDGRPVAGCAFLATLAALALFSSWTFAHSLQSANDAPIFYRMGHLNSGISPLLPILFLLAGMYLWSWQALAGNAMLRCGRPTLPRLHGENRTIGWVDRLLKRLRHLPLSTFESGWYCLGKSKYRLSFEMGKRIIDMASPVSLPLQVIGFPLALVAFAWVCFHRDLPLLGIESHPYAVCINISLLVAFFLTAAEASRLFWTWREFKRLLTELARFRLRRTFAKLRAVDANSLWSVSGNVHRVQSLFFSQQLDAVIRLSRLTNLLSVHDAARCGRAFARLNADRITNGPQWEEDLTRPDDTALINIRTIFADAAADVFNTILWTEWKTETTSLSLENATTTAGEHERNVFDMPLSDDETIRTAEEFVCLQYIAFIQNILARMRTMTLSMVFLFLAVCFAISFYPFVPRSQIGLWMLANLVLIAGSVISVYAGMERDETLSYIANTRPGSLSPEFWIKTLGFLAGPIIGLITTQFPSIAGSILGWLQPGLDAIK